MSGSTSSRAFFFDTPLLFLTPPSTDTPAELALIKELALAGGADVALVSNHWAEGGAGARELAAAVIACCEIPSSFKFLYDLDLPIEEKITTICKEIYGADGIELSDLARMQIDTYTRQGFSGLPSESLISSGLPFPAWLNAFTQLH